MPCEAAASECMPTARLSHHTVHTNNALARADDNDAAAYTLLVSADDPNVGGAFRGGLHLGDAVRLLPDLACSR